jgi:hypothetical protein
VGFVPDPGIRGKLLRFARLRCGSLEVRTRLFTDNNGLTTIKKANSYD